MTKHGQEIATIKNRLRELEDERFGVKCDYEEQIEQLDIERDELIERMERLEEEDDEEMVLLAEEDDEAA